MSEEQERQRLMDDADELTARTGMGLATTWGLIHQGDYTAARERLDYWMGELL